MTKPKIILSKIALSQRLKSFRTSAALILTTLMLVVAAATTVAIAQTYTVLYNFYGRHGSDPSGLLAQGRDGNLYGTTYRGGTVDCCYYTSGVVFRITPSGAQKVLYDFDLNDVQHGFWPVSGLTLGTDGNFYGTTEESDFYFGTIFRITKRGSLTNLYNFTGGTGGSDPEAPPIQGADGNFYGTTHGASQGGTVYKVTPSGAFTLLGSLPAGSSAALLQGADGNFYGTTNGGGSSGMGTVFKMTPKGVVTIVYNFDGSYGKYPDSQVIQDSDGNFYGTTWDGGSNGGGVVFRLTPEGAITVLHNFDPNYPNNDGYSPEGGLVQATDGNFYGGTSGGGTDGFGVIFQITPAGAYSVLHNFDGGHGGSPSSTLMQHTNGKIYALTGEGGTHDQGVVYSLDLGLAPFVKTVSTTGKVGKAVRILGGGLKGTSNVSFNGTPATFTVVSNTYLKTKVPSGATTGFVTVTTPGGTLTSNKQFRVKP